MVKGISRQVIVVHSPDPKLFEQAIFILKDEALGQEGVTDEVLLREANRLISSTRSHKKAVSPLAGPAWACGGALITTVVWLIVTLL